MARGYDEPFTLYGLLARTVETDDARSYVTFSLDPAARFSDGVPVTADDVIFSWQLLRDHGRPNHRAFYSKVAKAETLDARRVRFDLGNTNDRELPLILGLMPVLAQHAIDAATLRGNNLGEADRQRPLRGRRDRHRQERDAQARSQLLGPRPSDQSRPVELQRSALRLLSRRQRLFRSVQDRPLRRAHRDDPSRWRTGYDIPAVRDGRIVKEAFTNGLPKVNSAFVFNTRRPIFADLRVRQAITLLFDAEWVNRNFFFDLYRRSASFFRRLGIVGLSPSGGRARTRAARTVPRCSPAGRARRHLVAAGQRRLRPRPRRTCRQALTLLDAAGYEFKGTTLRARGGGRPFAFEIMVTSRDEERLALAFAGNLARAGIETQVRLVDAVQYDQRRVSFDFDMIENRWDQSLSPGNEQSFYWGSAAADEQGSRNYMGVRSAAVDAMIEAMLAARAPVTISSPRCVRSIVCWSPAATWCRCSIFPSNGWRAGPIVAHPGRTSLFGYLPETWWYQPKRALQ